MNYKITKTELLQRAESEKIGIQWFFLVHARVYPFNTEKQYYKRRFVVWFDAEDIQEHLDKDCFNNDDFKCAKADFIFGAAESVFSGGDIEQITNECNKTIIEYNN